MIHILKSQLYGFQNLPHFRISDVNIIAKDKAPK